MGTTQPVNPARRALLRGRLQVVAALRPPWAQPEAVFTEQCTRCGDCLDACPEQVLQRGDGGLPERSAMAGECTFCGDCVRACPTSALAFDQPSRASHRASIGAGCLGLSGIVCHSCVDACPERALRLPILALSRGRATQPELSVETCTGCAACVPVCPSAAITLHAAPRNSA